MVSSITQNQTRAFTVFSATTTILDPNPNPIVYASRGQGRSRGPGGGDGGDGLYVISGDVVGPLVVGIVDATRGYQGGRQHVRVRVCRRMLRRQGQAKVRLGQ